MRTRPSQSFITVIWALIIISSQAYADPAADVERAQDALDNEEIANAAKIYREAAEQNYTPAQVGLGEILHTTQENEEAVGWFLMAAYQGNAVGAYDLGQMYANGEGVEKNFEKAVYWITHAAEKNYLPAAQVLATAYRNGDFGLAVDLDQAKKWESRLPALRAAAQKEFDEKFAALKEQRKELRKAAMEKAAAEKAAAGKTDN